MRRDLLINAAGIGVGQLVVLLATPFLARIYSPSEFGQYAVLSAAAGVIATISSLRFDAALPAVSDDHVRPLFHIALALPFVVCFGLVAVVGILSAKVDVFATMLVVPLPWIAAVATLLGAANVCQASFTRSGKFKYVAILKIVQPVIFAATAFATVIGLNGALAISWLVVMLFALWGCRMMVRAFDFRRTWAAVKDARNYPLLSVPMALLDAASLALPLLFIASTFGNESAGNYSQVQRLLAAPLLLLGVAVGQVFYKHAGGLHRSGHDVTSLMWKVVRYLLGLAVLLVLMILLVGEPILVLLLGKGWRTDLQFLLLAVAPVMFRMVVSPVSCIFLITNRLGLLSAWQATYFVVTVSVILLARDQLNLERYLLVLSLAELAMYSLYLTLAVTAARTDRSVVAVKIS